jgi:hypothetical protein
MMFRPYGATVPHTGRYTRVPKGHRILCTWLQPRPPHRAFIHFLRKTSQRHFRTGSRAVVRSARLAPFVA